MSGMDRLSDDKLKRMAEGLFNALEMQLQDDLGSMARELLAHRRASQAAPAQPTEAMLDAARDWSDAKYGKPIGNDAAIGCWNAMLAAALSASLAQEVERQRTATAAQDAYRHKPYGGDHD